MGVVQCYEVLRVYLMRPRCPAWEDEPLAFSRPACTRSLSQLLFGMIRISGSLQATVQPSNGSIFVLPHLRVLKSWSRALLSVIDFSFSRLARMISKPSII